jgi:hypothetical protein
MKNDDAAASTVDSRQRISHGGDNWIVLVAVDFVMWLLDGVVER